jgi:ribosomal protein S18 acetylase RimI-like enzyme
MGSQVLSGFSVREANSNDNAAIKEICKLSFGPIYRYFAVQSLKSEGPVFVSGANGVVEGFTKLVQSQIGNCTVGDILWLAVQPGSRRKNVASNLIATSVSYFENHGIRRVYVSTGYRNKPAIALFQRNGFYKISFHDLKKIYGRNILRFYSEFWVAPTEVILMHGESLNGLKL